MLAYFGAMPGNARIGPRRAIRIYLAEWRDHLGLTQKQLGDRLGVTDVTISRWESRKADLSTNVLAAVAEALAIDSTDMYRHPDQPSADALLRGQPVEIRDQAMTIIAAIRRKN